MMEENKRSQFETEEEIISCKNEVAREERFPGDGCGTGV